MGPDLETEGCNPKLGFGNQAGLEQQHSETGIGFENRDSESSAAIREPGFGNQKKLRLGSETSKNDSAIGIGGFRLMTFMNPLP